MYNTAVKLCEKQERLSVPKNPDTPNRRNLDYDPTETLLAVDESSNRRILCIFIARAWDCEKKMQVFRPYINMRRLEQKDDSVALAFFHEVIGEVLSTPADLEVGSPMV